MLIPVVYQLEIISKYIVCFHRLGSISNDAWDFVLNEQRNLQRDHAVSDDARLRQLPRVPRSGCREKPSTGARTMNL